MTKEPEPKAADSSSSAARSPGNKPATKAEVYGELAQKTGLTRSDIDKVFTELNVLISEELGEQGPGVFVIPGLSRLKVIRKPATPERQGINPFTKEPMVIKAKPARSDIKLVVERSLTNLLAGDPTTPPDDTEDDPEGGASSGPKNLDRESGGSASSATDDFDDGLPGDPTTLPDD